MSELDVLLLIPFEDPAGIVLDPIGRRVMGGKYLGAVLESLAEFENRIGHPLSLLDEEYRPLFGGEPFHPTRSRSLASVTLSTHLERAGLRWHTLDPNVQSLGYWRKQLVKLRHLQPKVVGVSTTFIMSGRWVGALLKMVRELLPRAKVVVGGYYYGTDAKEFLSLDADVFCVGEGEVRFPQIVRALCDGHSLDDILGLYLPNPEGGLRYTGRAEPLDLSTLPLVDWRLVARIEPALDAERDYIEASVETQRGCAFKCGFCTFRTLASPNLMTPSRAVDAILNAGSVRYGAINIVDATATYPHERWENVLVELIARGGSRLPMWCYARVNDIDERVASLMSQAGVRQIFLGQESGDQRILNLMRKGTNIRRVPETIAALSRNNISVMLSLIHGYPGENRETVETTRRLLVSINESYQHRIAAPIYGVYPFAIADFAGVLQDDRIVLEHERHAFEYRSGEFTSDFWATECAKTVLATSRVAHAPVHHIFFAREGIQTLGIAFAASPHRDELLRWLKLTEKGAGLFLAHRLEGTAPRQADIDQVRRDLDVYQSPSRRPSAFSAVKAKLRGKLTQVVIKRLTAEWEAEDHTGPGALTRLAAGAIVLEGTGRLDAALQAGRLGMLPESNGPHVAKATIDGSLAQLAKQSVAEGIDNGNQRLRMVDPAGQFVPLRKRDLSEPLGEVPTSD